MTVRWEGSSSGALQVSTTLGRLLKGPPRLSHEHQFQPHLSSQEWVLGKNGSNLECQENPQTGLLYQHHFQGDGDLGALVILPWWKGAKAFAKKGGLAP